jgi:hypothetical protein
MDEASVKGQTVISFLKFVDDALPADKRAALMLSVPQRYRDEFTKRMLLATNTYPISVLNAMTIEGAKLAGVPVDDFARRAGRFSAQQGVQGVYRVFVRVLNTNTVLSKAAAMWSTMNTGGKMSSERTSANSAVIRLKDFPNPQSVMCSRVTGWIEHIAEITGVKPSIDHSRCAAQGGGECEWRITW